MDAIAQVIIDRRGIGNQLGQVSQRGELVENRHDHLLLPVGTVKICAECITIAGICQGGRSIQVLDALQGG